MANKGIIENYKVIMFKVLFENLTTNTKILTNLKNI